MDDALQLLSRHVPRGAQVLELDDGTASLARPLAAAGYHVTSTRPSPSLAAPDAADGALLLFPARLGDLIHLLQQIHRGLAPGGALVVADLVWQTAPTPELLRAFAPRPGGAKVRPIEGWEMQAEHAGFDIAERVDVPPAVVLSMIEKGAVPGWDAPEAKRAALAADSRGAAKVAVWALRRA